MRKAGQIQQLKVYALHSNKKNTDLLRLTLDEIWESGAKIIAPDQFLDCVRGKMDGEKFAILTFDDGHEEKNPEVVSILRDCGIKAVAFIIVLNHTMDSFMVNWDFWRENSDVFEIGSHSLTHTRVALQDGPETENDLRVLSYYKIRKGSNFKSGLLSPSWDHLKGKIETKYEMNIRVKSELYMSKQIIERALGQRCRFFSYPWGLYDQNLINHVRNVGYEAAFTTAKKTDETLFTIPRIDVQHRQNKQEGKSRYFLIDGCEFVYEQ